MRGEGQAVANSTCLIALERIDRLELLPQVFAKVIAPPSVLAELGRPIEWLHIEPVKDLAVVRALRTQLEEGEAHAIALAMGLGDVYTVLDDKKARRIAKQIGLKVVGTAGVLLRAKRQGAIDTVQPVLYALQQAGFRMSPALYQETLRLAGEENPT